MSREIMVNVAQFPQELKDQTRWCNWKLIERGGRMTKVPLDSKYGAGAKSNDESTWSTFDQAMSRASNEIGVGYFFKEPYVGIDLDDVGEDVQRHLAGDYEDNIVSEFINTLGSYTEVSPSGTGVHIIIKGTLPETGRRRGGVEIYDKGRFFTVTFKSIGSDVVVDDREVGKITALHAKYIKSGDDKPKGESVVNREDFVGHNLSDDDVIAKAYNSKQGIKFQDLYEGTWDGYDEYPSQSEADMSFANMLGFWTAGNKEQIDRIFRQSGLMRDKWDEMRGHDTYGNIVINRVVSDLKAVYKPGSSKGKLFTPNPSLGKVKDIISKNFNEPTLEDGTEFPIRSADDTGNAQRFLDRFGDIAKFNYNRKKFYIYDGQVWDMDQTGNVNLLIDRVVDSIDDEEWPFNTNGDDEAQEKARIAMLKEKFKHVKNSRSNRGKINMMEQTKHSIPVLPEDFDPNDMLLNTRNGYIDLSTGIHYGPDKKQMFSMMTEVDPDKDAVGSRWLSFLSEIFNGDQDVIDFIQRAVGYSLTGSVREQAMFILHGKGRNGKSVFVETIREILGSYTNNIQAKTLMVRSSETINNDIAKLQGSRMVTSSEPSEGFVFDEGLIKQLTGGDTVTARFLFGEEFNFNPKFKLWLTTNVKPIINGTDDGIWRRLWLIPFTAQVPEHLVDKDLKEKLLEESAAILQWAVEGALKWQEVGLSVPATIIEASKSYRSDMDELGQFIQDECDLDAGESEQATLLFTRYKAWAEESEFKKMNKNKFGQKMKEKFESKRTGQGIVYQGLRLN